MTIKMLRSIRTIIQDRIYHGVLHSDIRAMLLLSSQGQTTDWSGKEK